MDKHSKIVGFHDYRDSHGGHKIRTINPTIQSGSTVLFDCYEDMKFSHQGQYSGVTYGTSGLSTQKAFEEAMCSLENGNSSFAFSSGISAIINALMAFTRSGDEVLIVDNVYGPTASFCHKVLTKFDIKITHIESNIGAEINEYINNKTKLIFLESPGSNTFEIQDLTAIVEVAKKSDIITIIDSTWATPLYLKPLDLGIDVSIHSATKYICGYSDVLLGCVTINKKHSKKFDEYLHTIENFANPHDCYLALRGLRSLRARLKSHEQSAYEIARWLKSVEIVDTVIHPGLDSHPQHHLWKKYFTGASGLFSFTFKDKYSEEKIAIFMNALEMFGLGYSWGGFKSLATARQYKRDGEDVHQGKHLIRLNIGLENTQDLIEDLKSSFTALD